MAKFNSKKESEALTNYMGGRAFKQTPQQELAFAVLTTFLEDAYYEAKDVRIERIQNLVKKCSPEYVAKLAVYVRTKWHMRSVFALLVGELAKTEKTTGYTRKAIAKGTTRVDDVMEIVSYLGTKNLPSRVKRGVSDALNKFNSYQMAKYQGKNKNISLVDVVNLCHPKPNNEATAQALTNLIKGSLKNKETWEAKLSAGEDKAEVFTELLKEGKLGYMALLRNLRNIAQTGSQELAALAIEQLTNPIAIKNSKQLPFRFLSAYQALEENKTVASKLVTFEKDVDTSTLLKDAVEKAFTFSIQNIPILEGRTAILSDNSGSMRGDCGSKSLTSAYSKRTTADIANLFSVLYWMRADNTFVGLFGDKLITPVMDRTKNVMKNFETINKAANLCGAGTETGIFSFFEGILKEKTKVDRFIIFSDCQVGTACKWYDMGSKRGPDFNKLLSEYKNKVNPDCMVYTVDLKGYGKPMAPEQEGVVALSGWSDELFRIMEKCETNTTTLVEEIMDICLN